MAPPPGDDAQQNFGIPELCVAGRHPKVGGKSEFESAPECEAVDRADRDLGESFDGQRGVVELLREGECVVAIKGWEPFDVSARREVAGSTGQHRSPNFAVVGQGVADGIEFVKHRFVDGVHFSTVEADYGDSCLRIAFKLHY